MNNTIQKHNTPRAVFLYLLNILTFYLSVIGFIMLYIQYISALFPDALNYYYTSIADSVRVATSMVVVAVPVYILTAWLLGKDLKTSPERREGKLRKWLTYLTLFISAVTIIVNLIILVYRFMSGELTVQFLLKVLVVLLVAGAVFGYHIWDLRRKSEKSQTPKVLAWSLCSLVVVSVIVGFFIIGTPQEQRSRRFDDQRLSDLQVLQNEIINYWVRKQALPQSLNDLRDSISGFAPPQDPESKTSYEYAILNQLSFELCAVFKTSNKGFGVTSKGSRIFYPDPYYGSAFQQNWDHEAERTCFERTIDPELYNSKKFPAIYD